MIPIMASFYGLVAIFNQISMYMYYTVALSFAGVLWLVGRESNPRSNLLATAVLTLCWVGVIFHAAQPTNRTLRDMVRGDRVELRENDRFERARLWLESTDIEIYGDLIELVHQNTGRNDPILFSQTIQNYISCRIASTYFPFSTLRWCCLKNETWTGLSSR